MRPTAPRPVLRVFHQLSLHRICMHVFQLLLQLFLAPHIEIIESPLPKMRLFPCTALEWQRHHQNMLNGTLGAILNVRKTKYRKNSKCPYCQATIDQNVVQYRGSFRCPTCGIEIQVSKICASLCGWGGSAVAALICFEILHLQGGRFLLGFLVLWAPSVVFAWSLIRRIYPSRLTM